MKKLLIIISFFICVQGLNAQVLLQYQILIGKVITCKANKPLAYSHVLNETSNFNSLADSSGNYSIKAKNGDIIRFSFLGYKTRFIVFKPEEFNSEICLVQDTFQLKEVVALPFSNFTDFKYKFLAHQVEDKEYLIPGITLKERTTLHNFENENYVKSLGFAMSSPISYLYYNLSRHQQNIRRYYELENDKWNQLSVDKKFNREIVASLTGLNDDKLTEFMAWCNFSYDFLKLSTEFEIAVKVKEKYKLYCQIGDIEKDSI